MVSCDQCMCVMTLVNAKTQEHKCWCGRVYKPSLKRIKDVKKG